MGWNTVPAGAPDQRFGRVTPEQQARYTPLAYERAQSEWSWAGVVNTWYFKRATDEWLQAKRPEAYFRLADPDFTLQPVYDSLKTYMTTMTPVLHQGMHEAQGWAVTENGDWASVAASQAPYGSARVASPGATLDFVFEGTALRVEPGCGDGSPCDGNLQITVDDNEPVTLAGTSGAATIVPRAPERQAFGADPGYRGEVRRECDHGAPRGAGVAALDSTRSGRTRSPAPGNHAGRPPGPCPAPFRSTTSRGATGAV